MCEFLIFNSNRTHPDPEKDRRGCYKRGMAVVVKQDGHTWGREESLSQWVDDLGDPGKYPDHFSIIRVPDVDAVSWQWLCNPQYASDGGILLMGSQAYRRREFLVSTELLNVNARAALLARREVVLLTPTERLSFTLAILRVSDGTPWRTIDLRRAA